MKLIFICQAVDENDLVLGVTPMYIEIMARRISVEKVNVLALRVGKFSLPSNVDVHCIGSKNKLVTLIKFYYYTIRIFMRRELDCFYIYQGGYYPLLLLPFKILFRKPIYQWKTHTTVSNSMRFYAKYCNTMMFTASKSSFPMKLNKVKVIGHGINVDRFNIHLVEKKTELVTIGRISPVKKIETMIYALKRCKDLFGEEYTLDIYGDPLTENDRIYLEKLKKMLSEYELSNQVYFRGSLVYEDVPNILSRSKLFIFCCEGGLGKAALEAMACCLPVITTNKCVLEILPATYHEVLGIPDSNADKIAEKIKAFLSMNQKERDNIGFKLREIVKNNHSDESMIDNIFKYIN